jgi:hypothetical protein
MRKLVRAGLCACAVAVLIAALPLLAVAHSMYQSAVLFDFVGHEVHCEMQLPLERMETVFETGLTEQALTRDRALITDYIVKRFSAVTSDGRSFAIVPGDRLTLEHIDGAPYVVAHLILLPPRTGNSDLFDIRDDVLLDRIPSQVTLVSVRSDWSGSVFANDPQLVGILRSDSRRLRIDRTGENWFTGFNSIFHLGMQHIAEGTDHLLFLLTLLLPAPLLVLRRSWSGIAGVRPSLVRILKIVTAFTIGHSITLALATLGLVHVPSRPIEALIAVSILISAIHALRPIFPGREAWIAAFFGLVHGLAFASTLGELGLGRWERLASILAFNLGIETMQLFVVVATMPSLLLLSRTPAYPSVRIGGAAFAAIASLGWIIERLFDKHTSVDLIVNTIAHEAGRVAALLFLLSVVLWWLNGLRRNGAPTAEQALRAIRLR